MKFKKLTAVLLSAATLAAMPVTPVLRDVWQSAAVTAEAADSIIAYITVNKVMYAIYQKSDKSLYAVTIACHTDITSLVLPATVSYSGKAVPVTKIGEDSFSGKSYLTTVDLSVATNLTTIGERAFRGSSVNTVFLSGVRTTSGTLTVGKYAFADTNNLDTVYLQATVNSVVVQPHAFERSSIKNFQGYSKSINLQKEAFWQCMSLNYVRFNSNVSTLQLGESLFFKLYNLKTLRIEGTSTKVVLSKATFDQCGISSFSFPNTVTSIPANCFASCQISSFTMPDSVKSIGANAFASAKLPSTFKISKNVTSISDSAFADVWGVAAFSIDSSNSYYKTIDNGVLYTKNGTKLVCYPKERAGSSYTSSAKYYPDHAFSGVTNLKTLTLKNYTPYANGGTVYFPNLSNLTTLNVPTSLTGTQIMTYFHKLFPDSKLQTINGKKVLYTPSGQEPYFHSDFSSYICANFDQFEGSVILKNYVDKMGDWVVSQVVKSTDTPVQKIMKLRKWIMDRTTYDPRVIADENFHDAKNHSDASVFLHREKINGTMQYVTVCEGYSKCYNNLLKKAGIESEFVSAYPHAWNLVKLNGKWYHMDVTWDDQFKDNPNDFPGYTPYTYCFAPDSLINDPNDQHSNYYWSAGGSLRKGNPVATTDLRKLGDVNGDGKYNNADVTKLKSYIGKTVSDSVLAVCDLNFDGKITSADSSALQNYVSIHWRSFKTPFLWRLYVYET